MAFWSGTKLKSMMPTLVTEYADDRIDCAAYTLRMGRQYYLTASDDNVDTNSPQQLGVGDCVAIPSGQFAVLLTEETVTVPAGAIAFISMKTGLKGRGLVNVSGFHVDPGYSAPLRFAVFNAGPTTISVKQGEDCFLIWYADLDHADGVYRKSVNQNKKYARGISTEDVSSLSGAVKTVSVLAQKVTDLENTQAWMKWLIGVFAIASGIVLATLTFLSNEGIKSILGKTAAQIWPAI